MSLVHHRAVEVDSRYEVNPYTQNLEAQAVAEQYVADAGLPPIQRTPYVDVDPKVSRQIAIIFDETPDQSHDPQVQAAYSALAREVDAQFGYLPVEIVPFGDKDPNPYPDSKAMMDDVLQNRRLFVYTGGEDHSLLTRDQNWRFRAIHDYLAHAANGLGFGPRGEENAWISHARMFTPLARAAMTTETRGQNSFVNFLPAHTHLPPPQRPYAEQKTMILPAKYRTHKVLKKAYRKFVGFF